MATRRDLATPLFKVMGTQSWNDVCPRPKVTSNFLSKMKINTLQRKKKNLQN